MALITCQARVTSMSPGCSPAGNHHQACGERGDRDPAVALLLRASAHADVHQFEVLPLRLEPEIDGVLLLRLVLVVKDNVREPAIAFHAAHVLDLLKDEMEIGI